MKKDIQLQINAAIEYVNSSDLESIYLGCNLITNLVKVHSIDEEWGMFLEESPFNLLEAVQNDEVSSFSAIKSMREFVKLILNRRHYTYPPINIPSDEDYYNPN